MALSLGQRAATATVGVLAALSALAGVRAVSQRRPRAKTLSLR